MGRVSKRDQKTLTQLIKDCVLYGLDEKESIAYIEKRAGGLKISRSNFYRKKGILKNEENMVQERLEHHGKIGFVLKHLELEDRTYLIQKTLMRLFFDQSRQAADQINIFSISRIATSILECSKFLKQLNE